MSVHQRSNTYISLFEIEMFIFPIEFVGQSLEKYWIKRGCETDQARQAQTPPRVYLENLSEHFI